MTLHMKMFLGALLGIALGLLLVSAFAELPRGTLPVFLAGTCAMAIVFRVMRP